MAEEDLLETVQKRPFIDDRADDTETPDMTDPKLFTTPIPVDRAKSEASDNNTREASEDEDNSKIAEFNAVPEKGAGGDDDDDDDDDSDRRRTIEGSDNDDLIVATGEKDKIFGKKGKDKIKGNDGKKNKIYGGKDDDDCEGGDDDDEVKGDRGNDNVKGGKGNDKVNGGKDKDTLFGGTGNDTCEGDDGDDSVYGNEGDDDADGGEGNDAVYGGKGNDDCKGGEGNDAVRGDTGNDDCEGGDGNDTVNGGKDNDTVKGGVGSDVCSGDDGDDNVSGGDDNDTVSGDAGSDNCAGDDGDDSVSGGTGNDTVNGGAGGDNCGGDDGDDSVSGGTGNDTVNGGAGGDNCAGDDGDDSVSGGTGNDTVNGGAGGDNCAGDDGDDSVSGGAGDDTVSGGAGSDNCGGDDGDDSVSGGAGDDSLMGGDGNDACMGDEGDDTVMGGAGDDTLMAGTGNDTLATGDGNDMADGGGGDDSVGGGGGGDDTLMGGDGNDTLMGGTGNHTCVGGAGDDVYVVSNSTSGATSVITDYEDGKDKFLLFGGLNFSSLTFIQVGGNTEIRVNNFALALLLKVNATLIDAGDFLGVTGSTPTPSPTPSPTPNPIFNPPRVETNNSLTAGSSGGEQTITSELLSFVDTQQGPSGIIYKLTELPAATIGQLFLKGVAVTQVGFTFTQAEINARLLTFKAAPGYTGPAAFGFEVSNGRNFIAGQRFNLTVERNLFNFAGTTQAQNIVGSATLDNDIQGGDGNDTITAGQGKDKIIGGKGKDTIKGGDGDNDIDSGDDDDDIEVGKGKNKIISGKGKDKIKVGDGDNDIDSGDDDDDIEVGKGKNKIKGGSGNDKIKGGDDDDEIEGGLGINTLTGGNGKDRFIYRTSRQEIQTVAEADYITDFNVTDDVLELFTAAFGNLTASSLSLKEITTTSVVGSIGSGNLLDFTRDTTVTSIATLQARFAQLGGDSEVPIFCQFIDATTGRAVLVFALGARFEIVATFSASIRLQVSNFVFTGPPLTIPVGTAGADNVDFTTSPAPVNYDGLAGDDKIVGSNFNDSFKGGDGNDTITGGLGLDVLSGGTGADLFVYRTTKEGGDKISDFTVGVDKFEFSASEFGNLTKANFDGVSGPSPDITGKEFVIFTGGSYASLEAAQAKALGNSTTAGFFAFTNASNETVLYFDSNGTVAGGSTLIANCGTATTNLGTADFVFTGTIAPPTTGTTTNSSSVVDLITNPGTFPPGVNNFGSGAGGYNFTSPVLFTGNDSANSVTGTQFADILNGGGGADILNGGSGADILTGGSGADVLTGGAGADIFVYKATGEGGDTITDCTIGVDKFQFTASEFGNLTTTNFDGVSGVSPDITGKELVIFTGGSYASLEAAQAKALGNSTTAGFFAFTNASNETVLYFDSNGTAAGGSTLIANLGTGASNLGTADFVFTGSIASSVTGTPTNSSSVVDLITNPGTFPPGVNNFGSGAGGYNFTSPVLFTGNDTANSVTGTQLADTINGGGGADILTGGSGADILTGGAGADIFVYKATGEGGDTITDFTIGVDKFEFSASAFGNLTTTNFDGVSGATPDITGKELVIFTGGSYASLEAAQAKALGNSTTAGFFAFTNASNETVLYFDSNGNAAGGSTLIANLGTGASNLGTADFVFTGTIAPSATGTPTNSTSVTVDLITNPGTFPPGVNNFGSGGYNFTTPVVFTGDATANSVTGTEFADIFSGGSGADIFDGGLGNDSISGDEGNDSLFGGGGSDTLNGGLGNDTLIGGVGTNVLDGGDGLDVFVFSGTAAGGGDLITNYILADDVINLDKTGFAAFTTAGTLASSFYAYSSTVSVTALEATLAGPSIMAIYDSLAGATKLYYDSNGATLGSNSLFATVDKIDLGPTGNSELFLF
ncbi:cadherin-like domain-containing protein [Microcoleus sp. D2B6]|uniref:cadherin-like domain-containing protein n=1 Tax=Microcoleus sp. D2B6 TaxID=3055331 RepID=UPI002FD7698F